MNKTVCFLMLSLLILKSTFAATKTDYYALYDYLFNNAAYKENVRPAVNETHPITVMAYFYLQSLVEVDEKEQVLVTTSTVQLLWDDNYLSWDPSRYGGITTMLVPQSKIYLPDVIVSNSVRNAAQLGYPQQQARLNFDGKIDWEPNLLLVTACDIDITYFPFDTQTCYIEFQTAVSSKEEVTLKIYENSEHFSFQDFGSNGQWKVTGKSQKEIVKAKYKTTIRFGLLLKRRRVFYLLNVVLPVFFLSLTSSLVFALPADEGEKMGTGITVLLAFAVYLTIVSDLVPNTSLQVSILGLYLTTLLGQSAISIVVCVFILRLHFHDEDIPVGHKTTRLTLLLQRVTCHKGTREMATNKVKPLDIEGDKKYSTRSKDELETGDTDNTTASTGNVREDQTNVVLSWKQVAKTLDEVCFILFSVLSVVITFICLLVLNVGGQLDAPELESGKYVHL